MTTDHFRFVQEGQSPERLKLLLVLTVADILAVGPEIWNGWKASLMRNLYSRAEAVLGGAAPSEVSSLAAADAMQTARHALTDWDDDRFVAHAQLFYPVIGQIFRQTHMCVMPGWQSPLMLVRRNCSSILKLMMITLLRFWS